MRPTKALFCKKREPSGLGVQSRAPLAQSVEYWSYEPMVTGSSPVWSIFFFCSLPPHPLRHHIAGPIAQLVERWSNKPLVVGSIPTGTTLLFSCFLVQHTLLFYFFVQHTSTLFDWSTTASIPGARKKISLQQRCTARNALSALQFFKETCTGQKALSKKPRTSLRHAHLVDDAKT